MSFLLVKLLLNKSSPEQHLPNNENPCLTLDKYPVRVPLMLPVYSLYDNRCQENLLCKLLSQKEYFTGEDF